MKFFENCGTELYSVDQRREMVIIKKLDWIQSRHLLSTLKGELRTVFGDMTIELNKLRRKYR